MKMIVICLLAGATASCQHYLSVTTRQGVDVHVQGNRMDVMDSVEYRSYYLKDAYKQVNHQGDIYRLLRTVKDPSVMPD
jgi:hypothetical protein